MIIYKEKHSQKAKAKMMNLNKVIKFIFLYMLPILSLVGVVFLKMNEYLEGRIDSKIHSFINYCFLFIIVAIAITFFRKSNKSKDE